MKKPNVNEETLPSYFYTSSRLADCWTRFPQSFLFQEKSQEQPQSKRRVSGAVGQSTKQLKPACGQKVLKQVSQPCLEATLVGRLKDCNPSVHVGVSYKRDSLSSSEFFIYLCAKLLIIAIPPNSIGFSSGSGGAPIWRLVVRPSAENQSVHLFLVIKGLCSKHIEFK